LSDTDSALLPSMDFPAYLSNPFNDAAIRLTSLSIANTAHAATPVHNNDPNPVLISTDNGDIAANDPLLFALSKPVLVKAGKDILNVSFQIQHNASDSSSVISAGRDIKYEVSRNPLTGTLLNLSRQIEVAGPGQLTVVTGRNVDLGSSDGITSIGNTFNTALPSGGANISVVAGIADGKINVAGFADQYMANTDKYAVEYQMYVNQLTDYMRNFTKQKSLASDEALTAFDKLSKADRSQFEKQLFSLVQGVYFKELQATATVLANAKFKHDQDAAKLTIYKLIETLFPGSTSQADNTVSETLNGTQSLSQAKTGDISLFFSKIHTVDGGDINLLTPNGGVNAGLAVSAAGQKEAADVGIVVQGLGNINAIVRDNFAVNLTRVMTLGGGNIDIGSTGGNIDAGRGAQSSLSAPPPTTKPGPNGTVITVFPPVLSGSGIRTTSSPGKTQGDVLLYALNGIIDAGEAGIGGNNVTLSATAIVGAGNIQVGGVSTGVPVAPTGSIAAGLTGVSNLGANVSQMAQAAAGSDDDDKDKKRKKDAVLGMLTVEVLGFGE